VEERFFLDGINRLTHGLPIHKGIEDTVAVFSDAADSRFSRLYSTAVEAERAVYLVIVSLDVEKSLLHKYDRP
jgi:hypothetical protein